MRQLGTRILWQRARDYIAHYSPKIVAVGGSTGKTTAATALRLALGSDRLVRHEEFERGDPYDVAAGILGVDDVPQAPLDWARLLAQSLVVETSAEEPDIIIVEVGLQKPGDIDWLMQQFSPHISWLLNVHADQMPLFTSQEMVAHELASLVVSTSPEGAVVLNAEDDLVADMQRLSQVKTLRYGRDDTAHVQLVRSKRSAKGGFALELKIGEGVLEVYAQHAVTTHHVAALVGAISVAALLGVPPSKAAERIQSFRPPAGQGRLIEGTKRALVIDDADGATPASMLAGLGALRAWSDKRRIAVLGDIADLGGRSYHLHQRIGKQAAEVARMIVIVGDQMRAAGTEALMAGADVHHFDTAHEAAKWLPSFVKSGDAVYVSGGKEMRMSQVVDVLR